MHTPIPKKCKVDAKQISVQSRNINSSHLIKKKLKEVNILLLIVLY